MVDPMTFSSVFFDGAAIGLSDPPATPEGRLALENFRALRPADRLAMSRHVQAFCEDFVEYTGGDRYFDITKPHAIWTHISPRSVFVDHDDSRGGEAYVVIEAECDWEPEHGLMLCFLNGQILTKCGPYDGHLANDDASIVYSAHDPRLTTRRDP
jgi:hypothetical protein